MWEYFELPKGRGCISFISYSQGWEHLLSCTWPWGSIDWMKKSVRVVFSHEGDFQYHFLRHRSRRAIVNSLLLENSKMKMGNSGLWNPLANLRDLDVVTSEAYWWYSACINESIFFELKKPSHTSWDSPQKCTSEQMALKIVVLWFVVFQSRFVFQHWKTDLTGQTESE